LELEHVPCGYIGRAGNVSPLGETGGVRTTSIDKFAHILHITYGYIPRLDLSVAASSLSIRAMKQDVKKTRYAYVQ